MKGVDSQIMDNIFITKDPSFVGRTEHQKTYEEVPMSIRKKKSPGKREPQRQSDTAIRGDKIEKRIPPSWG